MSVIEFTNIFVSADQSGFARSNIEIVGSNPARDIDVCVHLFSVLFCVWVEALRRADPLSYRLCKKIKKLKKRTRPNKGL
jgi:hypothetical protein